MEKRNVILSITILYILVLYLPHLGYGFVIKGNIYDYYTFDRATNSVLSVNTTPPIRIVCVNGTYTLSLPIGFYTIQVHKYEKGKIVEEGEISIQITTEKGEAQEDILLFPRENNTISIKELDYADVSNSYLSPFSPHLWLYPLLITLSLLLLSILIYFWAKKRKSKKIVMDENMHKLISILKKEKRINQKEIKKEMKLSDAKISLMIAELEEKGIVEKIKRGRGNIIIYKG